MVSDQTKPSTHFSCLNFRLNHSCRIYSNILNSFVEIDMKKSRKFTLGAFLLFILFFAYRFSFRDDFRVLEILQITLSTLSDVAVVVGSLFLISRFHRFIQIVKTKWQQNILTLASSLIIYWFGVQLLIELHRYIYQITTGMNDKFKGIFDSLSYQVFDSYLVLAIGIISLSGYGIYEQWIEQKRLTKQAESERTKSELKYLKAQINPHFIFNTLNNIYILVDESNTGARNLIQDFSQLLRYQLYETGSERVLLKNEAKFLKQYMDIQGVRKEADFQMEYQESGIDEIQIPPLLLIIPLENAFKFSPSGPDGYVRTWLRVDENILTYRVENSVSTKVQADRLNGGLGIHNLEKRLALIYGERAKFNLEVSNNIAVAELTINLNEDEA
jgi:LytS/YehU family sensor histidine kinase